MYLTKEESHIEQDNYRIRKLTETECWRLMGFTDDDIQKAKDAGLSKTQLYKQAGNSIVVDVLYHIFRKLHEAMPYLFEDLKVGSYFSGIGAFESALDRLFADLNAATSSENEKLDVETYHADMPSQVGGGRSCMTITTAESDGIKKQSEPSQQIAGIRRFVPGTN